ncbi:MAG: DUF1549 domain-containing protein, partial [Pirellula sp.]
GNPIDAFIDQKLEKRGLHRARQAQAIHLLRRLHYDLTGLPPSPEVVENFLEKAQENFGKAWETEIDSLLASEHYGERWARHWLDLVRFADTNGFETNRERPNAWPFRDYV